MASVLKLFVFLAALIQTIQGEDEILTLGFEHNTINISVLFAIDDHQFDFCLFFKSTAEGNVLMWNSSQPSPENSTLPADLVNRLNVAAGPSNASALLLTKSSQSDSGLYRVECWMNGELKYQQNETLKVCGQSFLRSEYFDTATETVELPCAVAQKSRPNMSLAWFRMEDYGAVRVFVDGSLNAEVEDLRGRVQLVANSSSLRITNYTISDGYFACVSLDEQTCTMPWGGQFPMMHHRAGGQAVALPCLSRDQETHWITPRGWMKAFPSQNFTPERLLDPGEVQRLVEPGEEMYVVDGRLTDNYSLVIPSVTLNHSGYYQCNTGRSYKRRHVLLVCPESAPNTLHFSDGHEVTLHCGSDGSYSLHWYRHTAEHSGPIAFDDQLFPDDLLGRVNVSLLPTSMALANLSQKDSGEYWCSEVKRFHPNYILCKSSIKTFLVYQENYPYGFFYSAVACCRLLGCICAVVTGILMKTQG